MDAGQRKRARAIARRLARAYGDGHPLRPSPPRRDPLDELILTVLSQHTSDLNRDRAWESLRARYPRWDDVLAARTRSLANAIRAGGLAETKAPRIQAILREIAAREETLSLDRLGTMTDADARSYLVSLPGVGGKTAACVLAFALARPVLPVDTHVARIAERTGLARGTADAIQTMLEQLVPPRDRLGLHLDLIAHGRGTCRARETRCSDCAISDLCPSART